MIYFRCDASHNIGWGHLRRCLVLAEELNKQTQTTFIISTPTQEMLDLITDCGASVIGLPAVPSYKDELSYYPLEMERIILDLGHRKTLNAPTEFTNYLQALEHENINTVIIDGLDDDEFRDPKAPIVKAYVQPYWGVSSNPPMSEYWLFGADYVLLDPKYHHAYQYKPKGAINNILVTFGGADPQENTINVMKGLVEIPAIEFQLRVVIGPSFDAKARREIIAFSENYEWIDIIISPNGLDPHYQWADLCIGGSSTTRYEAASCGVPMLFASIYNEHKRLSEKFSKYGTAHYVGHAQDLTPTDWKNAVTKMLKNPQMIREMVENIKKMKTVEPGVSRLSAELMKIFNIM